MTHSSNTTVRILCGSCKSPAQAPDDPEPSDKVTCPGCGREDTFANVLQSVKDYVADRASQSLSNSLRDAVRGSKHISFKSNRPSTRTFRWVTSELGI